MKGIDSAILENCFLVAKRKANTSPQTKEPRAQMDLMIEGLKLTDLE